MDFNTLLTSHAPVLLDGGMGTMLQAKGLVAGQHPELAALEHPDWLEDIHRAYVQAGSQIISANTFGANRLKLANMGKTVAEVVPASIAVARKAAGDRALVALDIGPIGQILEPTGILPFDEAVDIFKETVQCGVAAGVDLIFIENSRLFVKNTILKLSLNLIQEFTNTLNYSTLMIILKLMKTQHTKNYSEIPH